jgi:hypothetical protein
MRIFQDTPESATPARGRGPRSLFAAETPENETRESDVDRRRRQQHAAMARLATPTSGPAGTPYVMRRRAMPLSSAEGTPYAMQRRAIASSSAEGTPYATQRRGPMFIGETPLRAPRAPLFGSMLRSRRESPEVPQFLQLDLRKWFLCDTCRRNHSPQFANVPTEILEAS